MEKRDKYNKIIKRLQDIDLPDTPVATVLELKDGNILWGLITASPNEIVQGSECLHFVPDSKAKSFRKKPEDLANYIDIDVDSIKNIKIIGILNGREYHCLNV